MFTVKTKGKEYKVQFKHNFPKSPVRMCIEDKSYAAITTCTITTLDDGNEEDLVGTGDAKLSLADEHRFNRNTGRKISLMRALQVFEKPDRLDFWRAYFNARNGKV